MTTSTKKAHVEVTLSDAILQAINIDAISEFVSYAGSLPAKLLMSITATVEALPVDVLTDRAMYAKLNKEYRAQVVKTLGDLMKVKAVKNAVYDIPQAMVAAMVHKAQLVELITKQEAAIAADDDKAVEATRKALLKVKPLPTTLAKAAANGRSKVTASLKAKDKSLHIKGFQKAKAKPATARIPHPTKLESAGADQQRKARGELFLQAVAASKALFKVDGDLKVASTPAIVAIHLAALVAASATVTQYLPENMRTL